MISFDKPGVAVAVGAILALLVPLACGGDDDGNGEADGRNGEQGDGGASDGGLDSGSETDGGGADGGTVDGGRKDGGGADGGRDGGGPEVCDDADNCNDCRACAMDDDGECLDEGQACFNNEHCVALVTCWDACVERACVDACFDDNPGGAVDANAYANCIICDECPTNCPDLLPFFMCQ